MNKQCAFPECPRKTAHKHHVVYKPKAVVVGLCREHHEDITIVNTNAAEATRRKLTNDQRWELWRKWLAGDVKPIRTENALAWIAKWDKPKKKWFKKIKLHEVLVQKRKGLVVVKNINDVEYAINPVFVMYLQKQGEECTSILMADKTQVEVYESFNSLAEKLGK